MTDEYESPLHAVARTARLVTSLTVTKRDARGFAEECGAERLLTSYWAGSGPPPSLPPHRHRPPRLNAAYASCCICICRYNQPLNKFPPLPRQTRFTPYTAPPAKIISQPFVARRRRFSAIRHSTRFDSPLRLLPSLPSLPLSLSSERISSSLYLFIHPLVLKLFVRKVSNSIDKKEKIPCEKKETRSRRRRRFTR